MPQIPIVQYQVGMPPMATPHAKVEKATPDTIYSSSPTLEILPALTNIDNLLGGVGGQEVKAKEHEQVKVEEKEEEKKTEEKEEVKKEGES